MLTDQQQVAVSTVDQNVLVSAGAGSGKTHVLVERYVEILRRSPAISLGHIIAVTFTRKAASEMRSRLKAKFLSLSKDPTEVASGNYMRWVNCLSEVDSARIGTIHSLCESIIRAYPADSGIDPEFESLDELTKSELIQVAVDESLRDVIAEFEGGSNADGESSWEYALLLSFSIDEIKRLLADVIGKSMQFEQAIKAAPELSAESFMAHAQKFINAVQLQELASLTNNRAFKRAFDYARANPAADPKGKLEVVRQDILQLCQEVFAGSGTDNHTQTWQALTALGAYKVGTAGGRTPDAQALRDNLVVLRDAAQDATAKVPTSLTPEDERAMNMAVGGILLYKRAQVIYQREKDKKTALDFNDQISKARACLEKPGSQARAYFNDKIKALLVDEFQDTNDVQADLLVLLAGDETRVFFIGDDKQSIYKFQGADVATFNKWKQDLANQTSALAGQSLVTKLNRSFRSHPGVVAFVNAVFAKLLDGDPVQLPYVAAFEALEPARQLIAESSARLPVATAVGAPSEPAARPDSPESGESLLERAAIDVVLYNEDIGGPGILSPEQLEAAHVAYWIKNKIESGELIEAKGGGTRPMQFGDFAVLVTKNSHFETLEEVFPRAGIPYVAFGGKGFLRRQEVADFENLLKFLDNPKDSHSLLAVLRSPLCPLTDDLIHKIATSEHASSLPGDGHESVPLWALLTEAAAKPRSSESLGGQPSVKQAVRLLRTILDYASLLPLGELVHKIITLTRYDLVLMAAGDGRQRSRNVWKIAHLARQYEHLTCGEFARKISDMRDFGMKEPEAPLDSTNAVKLMTVHNSKGLEFPAVALPFLGGQLTRKSERLIFHHTYGVAFSTKRLKEDPVPAWYQVASHFDKKMETEERKRLLYVAMTRARDCLGLFIRQEVKKNSESYRRWLLEHLGLNGHDLSLPDVGGAITLSVPGAHPNPGALHEGISQSSFELRYWFGFPPLVLAAEAQSPLVQEEARLHFAEEPVMSVFNAPINELALVRLTPGGAMEGTDDSMGSEGGGGAGSEDGGGAGSEGGGGAGSEGGGGAASATADFAVSSPRVIGTFFHALLENLPRSKKVERDWVRDIANNQGFHFVHQKRLEALVDEGMRLLDVYYASPLRALIEGAHRTFNETPYLLDTGEWIETKRPDLIIEANDGQWYLIDYKTDKFHPSRLDAQVRKHSPQLQSYVRDLKLISGVDLKAALYFAQTGAIEYVL